MSRARDLSRLSNPAVFSVDSSNNVGVNSTTPTAKLNVSGIVSATEFYGDGSNLEGVSRAGLGTALGETAPFADLPVPSPGRHADGCTKRGRSRSL